MIREPFKTLINAAVLAPSGDNTQPWLFKVDEATATISVCVDETRDTSPMNAGQRMARIACGAAVENIVQTAAHNNLNCKVGLNDSLVEVATVGIEPGNATVGEIPRSIVDRHTNRRPYSGRALSSGEVSDLERSVSSDDDIEVEWVTNRHELNAYAELISWADADMFSQPLMLRAFLGNVRFDRPAKEETEFGLPIGTLEASVLDRMLLPYLHLMPDALLAAGILRKVFISKARKLVSSASGLAIIRSSLDESSVDVSTGAMMQRIWLALTELGYQVQPMMSIPVLNSAREQGYISLGSFSNESKCKRAILRFGDARPASSRTGRRFSYQSGRG